MMWCIIDKVLEKGEGRRGTKIERWIHGWIYRSWASLLLVLRTYKACFDSHETITSEPSAYVWHSSTGPSFLEMIHPSFFRWFSSSLSPNLLSLSICITSTSISSKPGQDQKRYTHKKDIKHTQKSTIDGSLRQHLTFWEGKKCRVPWRL
jgi:hypothetical protein